MTPQPPAFVAFVSFPHSTLGQNWCAKCASCGEVLTKFDDDREMALRGAASVGHRCKGSR